MKDLIEALQIFEKYMSDYGKSYPTHCEHDVLMISCHVQPSEEDIEKLGRLSFRWSKEYDCWISYRFGSA